MTQHIVVREYAQLCIHEAGSPRENTLDCASVSPSAFAWLCELAASFRKSGASLCLVESRYLLRLDNYVGILATPCGTVVEILPKLTANTCAEATQDARAILIKMLNVALELPKRSAAPAALQTMALPLQEWVMWQFIQELEIAVKRGLRFDYQRIEDEQRFLRGQLDMAKQMRHAPTRAICSRYVMMFFCQTVQKTAYSKPR